MAAFRDATHLFVHAGPGALPDDADRRRICDPPEWTAHVGTTADESWRILDTSRFLDGAIVFIDGDSALGWALVWAFIERFPRTPVLAVTDRPGDEQRVRAASRGVTVWPSQRLAESALYLVKHRLHDGVYHFVCRLLLDHELPLRQFQSLLLAASGMAHKDVATKLGIAVASVRSHLQHAARTTGDKSVLDLLRRIRSGAYDESRKQPSPCSPGA